MPELERGISVHSENAKQDRLSLDIGEWFIRADETGIENFSRRLSELTWYDIDGSDIHEPIFQSTQHYNHIRKIAFRSIRHHSREGRALISGSILLRRVGRFQTEQNDYKVVAEVSVNPTRALLHQPRNDSIIQAFRHRDHSDASVPVPSLISRTLDAPIGGERSLNTGHNNVIIDRFTRMMASPHYWPKFVEKYLYAVENFFDRIFTLVSDDMEDGISWYRTPNFKVKEVETYWEFTSPDAIRSVYQLAPSFRSLGTSSEYREYDNLAFNVVTSANSPSLSTQLLGGVKAVLYPKTTDRIRLEVRHKVADVSGIRNTYSDFDEVVGLVFDLAGRATEHANQVLAAITDNLPPSLAPQSAYELVRQVLVACRPEREARRLLSVLVNCRGYRLQRNDPFRVAINSLARRGVLSRVRSRSGSFVLSGEYQDAADLLAQNASLSGLVSDD